MQITVTEQWLKISDGDQELATIERNGTVTIHQAGSDARAAQAFWTALADAGLVFLQRQLVEDDYRQICDQVQDEWGQGGLAECYGDYATEVARRAVAMAVGVKP